MASNLRGIITYKGTLWITAVVVEERDFIQMRQHQAMNEVGTFEISHRVPMLGGVADSGTATTVTKANAFASHDLAGFYIRVVAGSGGANRILSNTDSVLTLSDSMSPPYDSTTEFYVDSGGSVDDWLVVELGATYNPIGQVRALGQIKEKDYTASATERIVHYRCVDATGALLKKLTPCMLRQQSNRTIRQFIVGSVGTPVNGVYTDSIIKGILGPDYQQMTTFISDTDPNLNTAYPVIKVPSGSLFETIAELARYIDYRFWVSIDASTGAATLNMAAKASPTAAADMTIYQRTILRNNIKASTRKKAYKAIRVRGNSSDPSLIAVAPATTTPGSLLDMDVEDGSIESEEACQSMADALWAKYRATQWEGSFEAETIDDAAETGYEAPELIVLNQIIGVEDRARGWTVAANKFRCEWISEQFTARRWTRTIGVSMDDYVADARLRDAVRLIRSQTSPNESVLTCAEVVAETQASSETVYGARSPGSFAGVQNGANIDFTWTVGSIQPSDALTADVFVNYWIGQQATPCPPASGYYASAWVGTDIGAASVSVAFAPGTYYCRIFITGTDTESGERYTCSAEIMVVVT